MSKKKKVIKKATLFILVILFLVTAFNVSLKITRYDITTPKLNIPIRLALITDLHSCDYGQGQQDLINAVNQAQPDIILFGGDMVDDELPEEKAYEFLAAIGAEYPSYYVSGNHEFWSNNMKYIKEKIQSFGITILEGEERTLMIEGEKINIFGIDDPEIGEQSYYEQLSKAERQSPAEDFSILLAHRPERIQEYMEYDFDLILSGHAHGGQWRIPGIIDGLLAPDQGWFPEFTGGLKQISTTDFIISRGLSRESTRIPRIFNPPELVIIDINA